MKGCAYSFHSNEKPPEIEKNTEVIDNILDATPAQPAYKPMERPPLDAPMTILTKELSDSLKKQTLTTAPSSNGKEEEEEKAEIIPGVTQCVNKGCKVTYQGPETDLEVCNYHPRSNFPRRIEILVLL